MVMWQKDLHLEGSMQYLNEDEGPERTAAGVVRDMDLALRLKTTINGSLATISIVNTRLLSIRPPHCFTWLLLLLLLNVTFGKPVSGACGCCFMGCLPPLVSYQTGIETLLQALKRSPHLTVYNNHSKNAVPR